MIESIFNYITEEIEEFGCPCCLLPFKCTNYNASQNSPKIKKSFKKRKINSRKVHNTRRNKYNMFLTNFNLYCILEKKYINKLFCHKVCNKL